MWARGSHGTGSDADLIYPYECCSCSAQFDVIKSLSEIDRREACPKCSSLETFRYIARTHFYGASDWDKAEWNPAFGQIVRNAQHRRQLAKAHGLEEIGNEPVEKIHAHFEAEKKRQLEKTWENPLKL